VSQTLEAVGFSDAVISNTRDGLLHFFKAGNFGSIFTSWGNVLNQTLGGLSDL
jgi:hypothetical protein